MTTIPTDALWILLLHKALTVLLMGKPLCWFPEIIFGVRNYLLWYFTKNMERGLHWNTQNGLKLEIPAYRNKCRSSCDVSALLPLPCLLCKIIRNWLLWAQISMVQIRIRKEIPSPLELEKKPPPLPLWLGCSPHPYLPIYWWWEISAELLQLCSMSLEAVRGVCQSLGPSARAVATCTAEDKGRVLPMAQPTKPHFLSFIFLK